MEYATVLLLAGCYWKEEEGEAWPMTKSCGKICCMIPLPSIKPPRHWSPLCPFEPSRTSLLPCPDPLSLSLSRALETPLTWPLYETSPPDQAISPPASHLYLYSIQHALMPLYASYWTLSTAFWGPAQRRTPGVRAFGILSPSHPASSYHAPSP
jgi:hypothetical protein